jgi:hypothetical protein
MRFFVQPILVICSVLTLKSQTVQGPAEGSVTFLSSQNVYVKFKSTAGITTGDTLFIKKENIMIPALIVRDLSSISCVCIAIGDIKLTVNDKIFHQPGPAPESKKPVIVPVPVVMKPPDQSKIAEQIADTLPKKTAEQKPSRQQVHGYFSVASYTNFSTISATNSQRMKYTFSLNGRNLGNTNLSVECYASFIHSNKEWSEIQKDLFNGLKVYNLNVNYDFGKKASLLIGRKINYKLATMGPNDGLQFELKFKPITIGIVSGFRPDYKDFGFNSSLFQYAAYLYNEVFTKNGPVQTTLAFIDQKNSGQTDRRYLYLQHSNAIIKNLTFYGSVEADLYKEVLNTQDSTYKSAGTFTLTNLYVSLNWKVIKQLSLSFNYSSRHYIIYYETYKNYLDQLINNNNVLQGYSLQVNYRPVNKLSIGTTGSYRFEKTDPRPASNFYGYVTYSQIPAINIAATLSVKFLETSYISGKVYGLDISRDLAHGKLFLGLGYNYVDYKYYSTDYSLVQNVGEFNLTWKILRKLALSVYYEGTFENPDRYHRIYAQVNFGF